MKKLTTKLLVSILTVAFALVALGTTTFAWFTLSNTATVSQFDAQITVGEGIEISLDGTNYYTTIPQSLIQALIDAQKIKLKDITTENGVDFSDLAETPVTHNDEPGDNDTNAYIEFDLWVRSLVEATKVVVETITLTDDGSVWTSDAVFTNAKGKTVYPYADKQAAIEAGFNATNDDLYGQQTYHASDALRMSFTLGTATSAALVYEKPTTTTNTVLNQTRIENGMISYYKEKIGTDLFTNPASVNLPASNTLGTYADNDETKTFTAAPFELVTLPATLTNGYATQKMTVRLWVEGWDADTFNAILNAKIYAIIVFKAA